MYDMLFFPFTCWYLDFFSACHGSLGGYQDEGKISPRVGKGGYVIP